MSKIIMYSDGGCRNNQSKNNIGGWGVVLKYNKTIKELKGSAKNTTNNKMELTAVIEGLKHIKNKSMSIEVYVDSNYVLKGITEWIYGWIKKGWKTSSKKPVENKQLWIQLLTLKNQFEDITFIKVKGHNNVELNERVDTLANMAMDELENETVQNLQKSNDIFYDNNNIQINKEEAHKLFNKWKDLSRNFININTVIQNPDFVCKNDIEIFKNECEIFEQKYNQLKQQIIKLFK